MEELRRQYEAEVNRRRKSDVALAQARKKHGDELAKKDHHFKKMERFYKGELGTMRALYDETKRALGDIRGGDLVTKHKDLSKKHAWLKDLYNSLLHGDAGKAVRSVEDDLRKKDVEVQQLTRELGDMKTSYRELEKRLENAKAAPSFEKGAFAEAKKILEGEKDILKDEKQAIRVERGAFESEKAAFTEQRKVLEAEAEEIWHLQDELKRRQDENSELRTKVEFLEKEVDEREMQVQRLMDEVNKREVLVEVQKSSIERLTGALQLHKVELIEE
ncbi:hypothetical protein AAVH_20742 [Aphelenchoides avenae]|nr:hypothetical protein AAVH_20742 [Aphelenchus avenae]